MEEFQGNSRSPFLVTTYTMVDEPSTDSIVSWSPEGKSFIVWDAIVFTERLLPRYFKHDNFSNFIRQLNTYGFRKMDKKRWEFANDDFVRGQPHLMKNIHRKKPVFSHSLQNLQAPRNAAPITGSERRSLKDHIATLRNDRELILLQLQRQQSEKQSYELEMLALNDRLEHLKLEQKNIVSSLAEPLKEPPSPLHLTPQFDKNVRKRGLPGDGLLDSKSLTEDNQKVNSQAVNLENGDGASVSSSNADLLDKLESSLTFLENIVQDVRKESQSLATSNRALHESTSRSKIPACTSIIDVDAYPEFHNTNVNTNQVTSTRELYEHTGVSKCPLDSFVIDVDAYPEFFDIDQNTEPIAASTPDPVSSGEQAVGISTPFPTGYNDPFWQQFLTEYPGSSEQA